MVAIRFDVNDAALRESFLRDEVLQAIDQLNEASVAHWGRMSAQQMIEHLVWALELSTGEAQTECLVPTAELPRMKQFLYSNRPTRREFMNPALTSGLPALRYATIDEAKAALRRELESFLDSPGSSERPHTHPIFGPIGYDEWHRMHYKHIQHHLLQFGLITSEP